MQNRLSNISKATNYDVCATYIFGFKLLFLVTLNLTFIVFLMTLLQFTISMSRQFHTKPWIKWKILRRRDEIKKKKQKT